MTERPRFHLAFPVDDIDNARAFYVDLLRCPTGREDKTWIDFDFFGHQITAHLTSKSETLATNGVDGDSVPVRHFGAILEPADWQELADRLRASGADFVIEPRVRFVGQAGEQSTLFVRDPSGNVLEFKSFADDGAVFRH